MKLTIVTDHRFFKSEGQIFDDYVFDYNFFSTYLKVFDEVQVVARVDVASTHHDKWVKTSGEGVSFIELPNLHGIRWLLFSRKFFTQKKSEILNTDALCFRVPSHAAWEVFKLNQRQLPYMFEAIGNPDDAMVPSNAGIIKQFAFKILGRKLFSRMATIIASAQTGSYVSIEHLQEKFPVAAGVVTKSISSIRLHEDSILTSEKEFSKNAIRIIHVGSFIPLKNQKDLISLAQKLVTDDISFEMHFVGDGPLRNSVEDLAMRAGVSEFVTFHGQVTGFRNILRHLDGSDLFILPSSNEGMPRSLIEGMARGLICFGSDAGGISELLDKKFTFPPGDINEMYLCISRFLNTSSPEIMGDISKHNIALSRQFLFSELESRRVEILKILKNEANERVKKSS